MRFTFSTLLATTLSVAPAEAQQDTTRTRRDSIATLPDLTVTTTRSNKKLLDQPLAITKVTASNWYGTRALGLEDALQHVPGVLAQNRAGWSDVRLVIRGYGARGAGDRSNAGTSRGVRVLLDGERRLRQLVDHRNRRVGGRRRRSCDRATSAGSHRSATRRATPAIDDHRRRCRRGRRNLGR